MLLTTSIAYDLFRRHYLMGGKSPLSMPSQTPMPFYCQRHLSHVHAYANSSVTMNADRLPHLLTLPIAIRPSEIFRVCPGTQQAMPQKIYV